MPETYGEMWILIDEKGKWEWAGTSYREGYRTKQEAMMGASNWRIEPEGVFNIPVKVKLVRCDDDS